MEDLFVLNSIEERIEFSFASFEDCSSGNNPQFPLNQILLEHLQLNTITLTIEQYRAVDDVLKPLDISTKWLISGRGDFLRPETLAKTFSTPEVTKETSPLLINLQSSYIPAYLRVKNAITRMQPQILIGDLKSVIEAINGLVVAGIINETVCQTLNRYFQFQYARVAYRVGILKECRSLYRNSSLCEA